MSTANFTLIVKFYRTLKWKRKVSKVIFVTSSIYLFQLFLLNLKRYYFRHKIVTELPVRRVRTNYEEIDMRAGLFRTSIVDPCASGKALESYGRFKFGEHVDIVLATYDEDPSIMLSHLEQCCKPPMCGVHVYIAVDDPHDLYASNRRWKKGHQRSEITSKEWLKYPTQFLKTVTEINNTRSEATAYFTHLAKYYDKLAPYTAFIHNHVGSWHSSEPCKIIGCGLRRAAKEPTSNFFELNDRWYSGKRCISPRQWDVKIGWDLEALHGRVFKENKWQVWTGGENTPERMTLWCCSQFIATNKTIRKRARHVWEHLLHYSLQLINGIDLTWEHFWDTLIDEEAAVKALDC